jgi:hypothetical protein
MRARARNAGPVDLELRIDQLVIDGALLDQANPRALRAAIESALSPLLAGISATDLSATTIPHVKSPDAHVTRPVAAAALGTYISSAIGFALSPTASEVQGKR